MFFDTWFSLLRILVLGTAAYVLLILYVRLFGKRTLSKLSAFDLVVTVALGSTLSSIIVSKEVKLADGALALLVLCALQFAVAYVFVRSPRAERLAKAEPRLLYFQGRLIDGAMRAEMITEDDIRAAVRSEGIGDFAAVTAVVLESDGSLSVVSGPMGERPTLPKAAVSRSG